MRDVPRVVISALEYDTPCSESTSASLVLMKQLVYWHIFYNLGLYHDDHHYMQRIGNFELGKFSSFMLENATLQISIHISLT